MIDPVSITLGFVATKLLQKGLDVATAKASAAMGGTPVGHALTVVIRQAAAEAAEKYCPHDPDQAQEVRDALLVRENREDAQFPIVDGADLADLGPAVRSWAAEVFTAADEHGVAPVEADHPLAQALCEAIVAGIHHEATRGAGELHRLWNDYCIRELGVHISQIREAAGGGKNDVAWQSWWDPPVTTAGFVGRAEALEDLGQAVAGEIRLVCSVDGIGGVGKTALAIAFADQVIGDYPDGRVFLDFGSYAQQREPLSDEQALRWVLERTCPRLSAQDLAQLDTAGLRREWRQATDGKRILFVWDNVGEAGQIEPLLMRQAGCLTLVTSRDLLELPQVRRVPLNVMDTKEAVELFTGIAGAEHGSAPDLTARLVQLDFHMPVLVEHHAKALADGLYLSTAEIVAELETMPPERTRDALYQRQELSYRRLDADRQFAFRVLGSHPGDHLTAEAAAAAMGCEVAEARGLLDGLIRAGLAARAHTDPPAPTPDLYAYTARDVIRDYAADVAGRDQGELARIRRELVDHYQRQLGNHSPADSHCQTRLLIEHPAVLALALTGHDTSAARLALTLGDRLYKVDRYPYSHTAYTHAATLCERLGDLHGHADAQLGLGHVTGVRGAHSAAEQHITHAEALYRRIGNWRGRANALRRLGDLALANDDYDRARQRYKRAYKLYLEVNDQRGHTEIQLSLGHLALLCGNRTTAHQHYTHAAELFKKLGDQLGHANTLLGLGHVARLRGNYTEAHENFTSGIDIYRDIDNPYGLARALHSLGEMELLRGSHTTAHRHCTDAANIYQDLGAQLGHASALLGLGHVALAQGDYPTAADYYTHARDICHHLGDQHGHANALHGLGAAAAASGHISRACDLLGQAAAIYDTIGAPDAEEVRQAMRKLGCDPTQD